MNILAFIGEDWEITQAHEDKIRKVVDADITVTHDAQQALDLAREADIILCFHSNYTDEFLQHAAHLKWLHSLSAGVDTMLSAPMLSSNVLLTDSSGVHAIPISEHILGVMLMLSRQLHTTMRQQVRAEWNRDLDVDELAGRTVTIVGLGNIGARTAKLCKALEMKVVGVKRTAADVEHVDELYTTDELPKALEGADYVVSTLPLTKETHHLFDAAMFQHMRGASFINIGRGPVVDEAALQQALEGNIISAAALDVFEEEPLPQDSPLWNMPNVIITPHVSGLNPNYMDRAIDIFCENLMGYVNSAEMPNLVDKERGY